MIKNFLKGFFSLVFISLATTGLIYPATVFVHEGTHYIMYTMEGITVTSIHVLDGASLEKGYHGFVTPLKESRYGGAFQEIIAYSVEFFFMGTMVILCLVTVFKRFTIRQMKLMDMKKEEKMHMIIRHKP